MITESKIEKVFYHSMLLMGDNTEEYVKFLKENDLYCKRNYILMCKYGHLFFYSCFSKNSIDIDFNKLINDLYRYNKLKCIINDN